MEVTPEAISNSPGTEKTFDMRNVLPHTELVLPDRADWSKDWNANTLHNPNPPEQSKKRVQYLGVPGMSFFPPDWYRKQSLLYAAGKAETIPLPRKFSLSYSNQPNRKSSSKRLRGLKGWNNTPSSGPVRIIMRDGDVLAPKRFSLRSLSLRERAESLVTARDTRSRRDGVSNTNPIPPQTTAVKNARKYVGRESL